jgi:hypothetical protein
MSNELTKHRSWLRRNLVWLFPLILIVITAVYLLLSGVIGTGDYAKAYADRRVFEEAVQQAQHNERVQEILGDIQPLDRMAIAEGAVEYAESGQAITATITLKGSKAKGKMDIEAHKADGNWIYDKVSVRTKEPKQEVIVVPQQ